LISCLNVINNSLIATAIVLEHSFFSLQRVEHASVKIAELVASEYVASQTPLVIKQTVEELLHQHHHKDGGDEKLCKMIIDETLHNRMCESSFAS
jgi:hypothetical protein